MRSTDPDVKGSLLKDLTRLGWRELCTCAVLSMFINVLALTMPLYMMQVFTHVLTSESESTLGFVTLIALVALLAWFIY